MNQLVRVSGSALMTMLLNGIEAYKVRHLVKARKRKGVETFGTLWGYESRAALERRKVYHVDFVSIDTSARRSAGSVDSEVESLAIKRALVSGFWPHYEFLGDFHTHPFPGRSFGEVRANRFYEFSRGDRESIRWHVESCGLEYRVGLVLTIIELKRAGWRKPCLLDEATIEFTMNRFRLWLRACCVRGGRGGRPLEFSEKVYLDCPGILGLKNAPGDR